MSAIAEKLYVAWRRAFSDPTAVPAFGNLDAEDRRLWVAVEGATVAIVLDVVRKSLTTCDCRGVGCVHDQVRAVVEREVADRVVATGGDERKKLIAERDDLKAKVENAEAAWQESVSTVDVRIKELEAEVAAGDLIIKRQAKEIAELAGNTDARLAERITRVREVSRMGRAMGPGVDLEVLFNRLDYITGTTNG